MNGYEIIYQLNGVTTIYMKIVATSIGWMASYLMITVMPMDKWMGDKVT